MIKVSHDLYLWNSYGVSIEGYFVYYVHGGKTVMATLPTPFYKHNPHCYNTYSTLRLFSQLPEKFHSIYKDSSLQDEILNYDSKHQLCPAAQGIEENEKMFVSQNIFPRIRERVLFNYSENSFSWKVARTKSNGKLKLGEVKHSRTQRKFLKVPARHNSLGYRGWIGIRCLSKSRWGTDKKGNNFASGENFFNGWM